MCDKNKTVKSILFILHSPPPIYGVTLMGKYIQESNYLNNEFNTKFLNLSTSKRVGEIGKNNFSKFLTILKLYWNIIKTLNKRNYDLCYLTLCVNGLGFYKDFIAIVILKTFGQKMIYHIHNKGIANNKNSPIKNYLLRFAFKETKIILLSELLYHDVCDYVRKEDVFFCANGIPLHENIFREQKILKTENDPCRLLFFSNMITSKGVYVLIEACKILKDKGINFHCHFAGEWSDVTEVDFKKCVSDLELEENLFSHGLQYGLSKFNLFMKSDIFVFPTLNDCFPLVLLEAMQFGIPVISTFEGGIPDVVNDGISGYLVPKKNPSILAQKIQDLIQHPKTRSEQGNAAIKLYEEYFTLEIFEKKLGMILNTAANNN